MSIKIMSKVYDLKIPTVKKFVLLVLADHADHAGYSCYPSIDRIALYASINRTTAIRALNWLVKTGYVKKLSTGGGAGKTNQYCIIISALEEKGGTAPPLDPKRVAESHKTVAESHKKGGTAPPEPSVIHQEPGEQKIKTNGEADRLRSKAMIHELANRMRRH